METEHDLDRVLKTVVGDYMKSTYAPALHGALGRLAICCRCPVGGHRRESNAHSDDEDDIDGSEIPDPEEAEKHARELVFRDLFFWAVLTNRIEMSKVLLSHMQTRICAALIGSKILKSYVHLARDNDSKDILNADANKFEEYAIKCLKFCYNYDEGIACEIAIRRIKIFGGVSCLQVRASLNARRQTEVLSGRWPSMRMIRSSSVNRAVISC